MGSGSFQGSYPIGIGGDFTIGNVVGALKLTSDLLLMLSLKLSAVMLPFL